MDTWLSDYQPAVDPAILRTRNQIALLEWLYEHQRATRPEIAAAVGVSQPTVIAALSDLERFGLVQEDGTTGNRSGRPAKYYRANPDLGGVLVIDVGRQWVRVTLADISGRVRVRTASRHEAHSANELTDTIREAVDSCREQVGLNFAILQVVVGSPGVFRDGEATNTGNDRFRSWQHPQMVETLKNMLDVPFVFENDVNLAAIGEYHSIEGDRPESLVYIQVGSGVGIGIVFNGRIYRGHFGAAGEVATLPPLQDGFGNGKKNPISLEHELSSRAVVRYALEAGMTGAPSAEEIFSEARKGNAAAIQAVKTTADRLSWLIISAASFIDPAMVIVAGGVGQNYPMMERAVLANYEVITDRVPVIRPGALQADATSSGALQLGLRLARNRIYERLS